MKLWNVVLVTGTSLALAGCVAVWGKSYSVKEATETTFRIQYDPSLTSSQLILLKATEHCKQFGKKPEIAGGGMPGVLVGIIEEVYYCYE